MNSDPSADAAEIDEASDEAANIAARYPLLCRSTQVDAGGDPHAQQNNISQQNEASLQALDKLLTHDLQALARRGSPDDFADLYFALQQELERFREFCAYPALAQKFVVAFGGSFSAGKSSLINAVLGQRLLVTEVDPTTSLPTYLLKGERDAVHALNLFGHRIELSSDEFLSLTHDEVARYGSNVSRLLRAAFIARADFPWDTLALIDTPGYTKHEDQVHGARTDEQIARTQLNAAQAIVWVIDARQGGITEDDLKFLASLQADVPRLIAVSRADQKTTEDMAAIVAAIKKTLSGRNVAFVDVLPVSARNKPAWPLAALRAQLTTWSQQTRALRFAHNFKAQFTRYSRSLDLEERRIGWQVNRLNRILVFADSPEAQTDAQDLKADLAAQLARLGAQQQDLAALRQRFFTDLKRIGDAVGVPLPEPRDIDLLSDTVSPLLGHLTALRERQGKTAPDLRQALRGLAQAGEMGNLMLLLRRTAQRLLPALQLLS